MSTAAPALRHEILVLDANLQRPLNPVGYKEFTRHLVTGLMQLLHMEELGPLQIYPATDMSAPGWSFIQPITTSHISGHYFVIPGEQPHIHMDIYSCKSINFIDAIKHLNQMLKFENWSANFLQRNCDFRKRKNIVLSGIGNEIAEIENALLRRSEAKRAVAKTIARSAR